MHGEQGALLCTAKIVETVPWIDAKYYASTQVMDEARHVEVFAKYLDTKLSGHYPINAHLKLLLDDIVTDSRWDMTYLGMQIMVEGLALAAFGFMHQLTTEPLLKQLLRYVMTDEARHVAFGVLSLKEYYDELTDAEMRERQEFAFEAAVRMRDRFLQQEVWERMGLDVAKDVLPLVMASPQRAMFQSMLFSKIVPNCKKLGLLDANDGWLRTQVHRARRDPVRGLGRHRRGVRDVPAGGGRDRGLSRRRPAYARGRWTAFTTWAACTASDRSRPRRASRSSTSRGRVGRLGARAGRRRPAAAAGRHGPGPHRAHRPGHLPGVLATTSAGPSAWRRGSSRRAPSRPARSTPGPPPAAPSRPARRGPTPTWRRWSPRS